MHELSIAQAIVEIAAAHVQRSGPDVRVVAVQVRVGHLRQVVPEALRLGFELCAAGTRIADARLNVEHVPAVVHCRACDAERVLDGFPLACPGCGSVDVEVVSGEELAVEWLELEYETETDDDEDEPVALAGPERGADEP